MTVRVGDLEAMDTEIRLTIHAGQNVPGVTGGIDGRAARRGLKTEVEIRNGRRGWRGEDPLHHDGSQAPDGPTTFTRRVDHRGHPHQSQSTGVHIGESNGDPKFEIRTEFPRSSGPGAWFAA